MKILLVDDDVYVLEAITKKMDWDSLGIKDVFTAQSARQAREIIQAQETQIMISDIEMPGESGLDLLNWIRENGYHIQAIFLTSYAEFSYAQKAIELKSLNYYLKPVAYEALYKGVAAAAKVCAETTRLTDYKKKSEYLESHSHMFQECFWTDYIRGSLENQISYRLKSDELPYTMEQPFLAVCFRIMPMLSRNLDEYLRIHRKNLEETLRRFYQADYYTMEYSYIKAPARFGVCLKLDKNVRNLFEIQSTTEKLIDFLEEEGLQIFAGMTKISTLDTLYSRMEQAEEFLKNVMETDRKVQYVLETKEKPDIAYNMPDMETWESVFESGSQDELCGMIDEYLSHMVETRKVNRFILKMFQLDMEQLVYRYLSCRHVEMQRLFDTPQDAELSSLSLQSVKYMKYYSENLIRKSMEYTKMTQKTESVVKQIRDYLDQQYCTAISRETLSGIVYLNPDYISRLFKKEMKVSINTYIIDKRIEKARNLLLQTNIPVNAISMQVGYSNFSYFTKLFREKTGQTPLEYRRSIQK